MIHNFLTKLCKTVSGHLTIFTFVTSLDIFLSLHLTKYISEVKLFLSELLTVIHILSCELARKNKITS